MPKIFLIIAGTRGRKQRGEILITTLIFVMLGFLIVFPLLAFMATGLNSSRLYTVKNGALYSADAGIEDAIWQIKYEHLSSLLNDPAEYDEYDFETTWQYTLPVELNQNQVEVTVNNVWIPYGIDTPTITAARAIANNNRLLVTGGMQGGTTDGYHATVTYYPATGEDLLIDSIGVWLPPGFSYTAGSSNVENSIGEEYYAVPEVIAYKGGYVIIWDFASVDILDFPNVDTLDYPMTCDVTFNFTADKPDTIPDAVCWLETSGVSGMEFCWDYDVKVFKITSTADSTSIETYVVKSELRQLNGALNGDYIATGNTLMQDAHYDSGHIRDSWLNAADHSSSASIDTIDSEAEVAAAFLYWTGWKKESEITYVSPLNPEDCSDMTAWNVSSPNAWSVSSGAYQGHYSTGDSREIHLAANINLSAYSDAKVALCWQQKVGGPQTLTTFSEGFSTTTNWTLGSSWSLNTYTGQMNAHFSGGLDSDRYLTLASSIDLSTYVAYPTTVVWNQDEIDRLESDDALYYSFSGDNGVTWSSDYLAFADDNPPNPISARTIPSQYLTSTFKIRFRINGFSDSGETCTLDNVSIQYTVTPQYSEDDGLDFALYKADTGWSDNIPAFRGDIGTSYVNYYYFLPPQYISAVFNLKFTLAGCSDPAETVYLDNIYLKVMLPDKAVFFKINGSQVYCDSSGEPQEGAQELTADKTDAILNISGSTYKGFSYTGFKNVTDLVKHYSDGADSLAEPPTYGNGNGSYTVGNVDATLGIDGGDYQLAHAGWALIVVYTSPATLGHQLYLYDRFAYADDGEDLDFDKNGTPGGDISGFIVPERIRDEYGQLESVAAKITCCAGEGDYWISGDFITLNAPAEYWDDDLSSYPPSDIPDDYKLWDQYDTPDSLTEEKNNVWNSFSTVCSADGIDIDTFIITWDSGLISEGDTTAHVDIYTSQDNWNLVFLILAFRNETTTGGSLSYLIHG